jgi:hypothetical protein
MNKKSLIEIIEELKVPALYATEEVKNPTAYLRFFTPDSCFTWYVTEYDRDNEIFFGLVVSDMGMELGYFSLDEILTVTGPLGLSVENTTNFTPESLDSIKKKESESE